MPAGPFSADTRTRTASSSSRASARPSIVVPVGMGASEP